VWHAWEEIKYTDLLVENLRQGNRLEDLDVVGRMILKRIVKKYDWIRLAEIRDKCPSVVDTVLVFILYKIRGFFLSS